MRPKKSKSDVFLPRVTHRSRVFGAVCGDALEVFLRVDRGVIREAHFQAQACRATVDFAKLAAEKASGASDQEIFSWSAQLLCSWIPQANKAKAHAAELVIEAFQEALRHGSLAK